jgi:tripartite-type tricarboxylate transporter receptor subunit TctC
LRAIAEWLASNPSCRCRPSPRQAWPATSSPAGPAWPTGRHARARSSIGNAEIAKIAAGDETRQWFERNGSEAGIQSPQEFADFIRLEYARLGQLIRDARVRAE